MLNERSRLTGLSIIATGSISPVRSPRACLIDVGFDLRAKKILDTDAFFFISGAGKLLNSKRHRSEHKPVICQFLDAALVKLFKSPAAAMRRVFDFAEYMSA